MVSVILTLSDEIGCGGGTFPYFNTGPLCTRYVSDTEKRLFGTLYHFGRSDRRVRVGWTSGKAGRLVAGGCCDVGWYLVPDGTAPPVMSIFLEQMVPTDGLVFATTFPPTATIDVQKCTGGTRSTVCITLAETTDKQEFFGSANGSLYMVDSNNTLFLKLVNEKNIWFGEAAQAHVLASDLHWQARYIVRSSVSGASQMLLPPETWMDDGSAAEAATTTAEDSLFAGAAPQMLRSVCVLIFVCLVELGMM